MGTLVETRHMPLSKTIFSTDLESFSRERDNAVVAWSLHMGALPVSEPLKMEKKEKKSEIKQDNMKKADVAFELWLKKGLHQLFDDVANEPVPQELLDLIERDRNT
jgi:hypothetical protein